MSRANGDNGGYQRRNAVPALPEFDKYPGKWVATMDRKVVAVADTSLEITRKIQALGLSGKAVARYVPPDDDVIVMGVG